MFRYVVENRRQTAVYSQNFPNKNRARIWYNNHGKKLEEKFNRVLKLVEK